MTPKTETTSPKDLSLGSYAARLIFTLALFALVAKSIWGVQIETVQRPAFLSATKPEEVVAAVKAVSQSEMETFISKETERFLKAPLEGDALNNLMVVIQTRGDDKRGVALARLAADRSLRNLPAQVSVIQTSFAQKNYSDAFYRLDGLIRTQIKMRPDFYSAVEAALTDPAAIPIFAKLLATTPPWRGEFLRRALGEKLDPETAYALIKAMKLTSSNSTTEELRDFINRLLNQKREDTAYFVWLDSLNDSELKKVNLVFDSGFDFQPQNLFFGWTLTQQEGSQSDIVARAAGSADHVLRVQFVGSQGFYGGVEQFTRIPAGAYTFVGQQRTQELKTSGGLSWRLYCYETNQLITETKPLKSDTDWSQFSVRFDVPAEHCDTQFLRLESSSKAALDMAVTGSIYFDDLAILPIVDDAAAAAGQPQ